MKIKAPVATDEAKRLAWPLPVFSGVAPLRMSQNNVGLLTRAWKWIRDRQAARTATKRLHVAATVSLGEKRFAAVLEVDGLQFLIGGGGTNVSLLAQLTPSQSFDQALRQAAEPAKTNAAKRTKKAAGKSAAKKPEGIVAAAVRPEGMRSVAIKPAPIKPAVMKNGGLLARKQA
jgi:flagellar biogenesis protein FliO